MLVFAETFVDGYSRMMDDVENGKIGVCIMKDLTRWGRDYLQVGNAMEIFRRNNVRFIAVNNGIDSEKPDTLEFAPFINIMSVRPATSPRAVSCSPSPAGWA